ncbi:unnamed protein product [Oppiella nova]|uniref:BTB domain-containing protein n=1 Tax=Oppiella nova TaxID=334625 RepID=A0A7R9LFD8_9ACAR|nr:unnamed protein product [Oppiella nova]CAG2163094.1 unnamed protein product [Oppiella nova]
MSTLPSTQTAAQGASQHTIIKSEIDFQRLINGECDRLVSRASNLLQNKSFTDVTFIVGPPQHSKKYVGHRVLLAMTSPVFEAMFYGDMADKSKVIRIPDIAPIGFENLLRYAYTDSLNLNSVEDAMLTAYAAKKYLLPHLLRECLTYIEKNITPSSACAVYEFATVLNSQQLVYQSMNTIDRQTYHVITHKSFNNIQLSTLEFIVSRRYLNLYSEFSLFNSVIQWTQNECKRRSANANDWIVIRGLLEDSTIMKNLRFLTMSAEEFARVISQTTQNTVPKENGEESYLPLENAFMNKNEQIAIFMNLAIPGLVPITKSLSQETTPRCAPPEYFTVRRYKPVTYATTTTLAHASQGAGGNKPIKTVCTKFQVMNSDLFIVGASIPIRLDPGYYSVRTPKLDCQLKFTSKMGVASEGPMGQRAQDDAILLVRDTVDDSITLVISKDKDCHVKLKRPLSVKKGNLNELLLTFQSPTLNDDIVVIKGHRNKSTQTEVVDGEAISWVFFKSSKTPISEAKGPHRRVRDDKEWHLRLSQNYYQILGIDEKSDKKRIRLSYLKLCKRFHPDLNQTSDPTAQEVQKSRLQDINKAYNCLINDERRRDYDLLLRQHHTIEDELIRDADPRHQSSRYRHYTYYYSPNDSSNAYNSHNSWNRYNRHMKSTKLFSKQQVLMACSLALFMSIILHLFQYSVSVRHLHHMENKWRDNGHDYWNTLKSRKSPEQRVQIFEQGVESTVDPK